MSEFKWKKGHPVEWPANRKSSRCAVCVAAQLLRIGSPSMLCHPSAFLQPPGPYASLICHSNSELTFSNAHDGLLFLAPGSGGQCSTCLTPSLCSFIELHKRLHSGETGDCSILNLLFEALSISLIYASLRRGGGGSSSGLLSSRRKSAGRAAWLSTILTTCFDL